MHVIAAGLRRTGSTWLYNVARLGYAKNPTAAGFGPVKHFPEHYEVIKSHAFCESYRPHLKSCTVLMSVRDPRDIAASAIRHGEIPDIDFFLKKEYHNYLQWRPYVNLEIRYEDIAEHPIQTIENILNILGSKKDPIQVATEVKNLPFPEYHDPLTELWHNHVTNGKPGSYRETLDEKNYFHD